MGQRVHAGQLPRGLPQLDGRLTQRPSQAGDLGRKPLLPRGRAGVPGGERDLAGLQEARLPRPIDCSLTFSRRAASAIVISPARTLMTIRALSRPE
jgi:hypothetical protein